jgi:regulatory protein
MRMLSRRALSEGEIRGRLKDKGFPPDQVENALVRLGELGLVDDRSLCVHLARSFRDARGYGPLKIAAALRARSLPGELIAAALRESDGADEQAAAESALRRRFRGGIPPGREGAAKAYRFLAGRGFLPETCRKAVGRRDFDYSQGET